MPKPPTVYDVAARAEVSIATVSRVLTAPDSVKPATREKVVAAVRELGYVPSASARGLAARRTNVIGLFVPGHDEVVPRIEPGQGTDVPVVVDNADAPDAENLYYDEVLRGAELEAGHRGFALMIASGSGERLEKLVTDLAGRVDGLAVLEGTVPTELLDRVSRRIPVVVLGGAGSDDRFDHVASNNGPGMRALADYLVGRGAQSFVYVAGPEGVADDEERFSGFCQVVPRGAVAVHRGDFTRAGGRRVAESLESLPDAIVCANDQMALGVLDVLGERGILVPEKVQVTGFDGIVAGRHSRPTLTTVHQPMSELGRAAVRLVTERLDRPDAPRQTLTLPVRVVVRQSTT